MEVHGVEPVGKRRISVPLVRARVEHHAAFRRHKVLHARELPRRLRDDRRGEVLPADSLPGDLPFGDVAARRDLQERGERRIRLAVGVVDLRLEEDASPRSAHRLTPHGKRLAARPAVARRMDPLVSKPVGRAARPGADDEFLLQRFQRVFPRLDRERDLAPPVSRGTVRLAPVADAVESVVVPQRDDDADHLRHGDLAHGFAEECGRRGVARTKRPLLPRLLRRHALRGRVRRDELVVPRAVPLRGVASVQERIRIHAECRTFAEPLRARASTLEIDRVRAGRRDPVAQRLRRTAHVQRTYLEMRIAHERIARGVHPAVRLVVRVEKRPRSLRLDDKPYPFPIPCSPPLHDVPIVFQRQAGGELV